MANVFVRLGNWFGHLFTDEAQAVLPVIEPIILQAIGQVGPNALVDAINDPNAFAAHLSTIFTNVASQVVAAGVPVAGHVLASHVTAAVASAVTSANAAVGTAPAAPSA